MATKRLAKELGFVRKRSQSTSGLRKTPISKQIFSYLIVIDFESTCWREKNNYGQEIIEFPAVLVSTATGEVESEFHTYVQPQEHPTLSDFCTELTGITQSQVETGVPLQICLSRFNRWLQTLQLQKGVAFPREHRGSAPSVAQKPCAFLTWSDWDLGVCLQYECKRKQLHKPDALNSWIDLRATYRLFYNRKPKGLNGALQDLGIQFSGREHSGLDDARNTARLAVRMMRDGCVMKITRSLDRAPLKDRPIFGNTNVQTTKQKETDNITTEQKVQSTSETPTNQASVLRSHSHSSHAVERNGTSSRPSEPVQAHRSLVSPRTLLNGLATPLLGTGVNRFVRVETATNHYSPGPQGAPVPNNKRNSLILFSTTVDCLTHMPQLHQTSEPEVTADLWGEEGEEEEAALLVETEERCGAYDTVVLEDDDVAWDLNTERGERSDAEETVRSLPEEPVILHPVMEEFNFKSDHSVTKRSNAEITPKPQVIERVGTSLYLDHKLQQSITSVSSNETRRHSSVSLPGPSFIVPEARTCKSASCSPRQHTVALGKPPMHLAAESSTNQSTTRNLNSSSLVKTTVTVPSETFVRPKPVGTDRNDKNTVNDPFTIYIDPAKPSIIASCPSNKSLSSASSSSPSSSMKYPSILSSSTNRSSFPPASRDRVSKITAPLCACGRRAKRLTVANGGPNHGRGFYCCPVRRSGSGNTVQKGCQFFKWESALLAASCGAAPARGSSISAFFNSSLHHRPPLQTSSRKSY